MNGKPKDITIGYFDLLEKTFISAVEIDKIFLNLLSHYVKLKIIPITRSQDLKEGFINIDRYKLDYLYVDTFNFLLHSFLLREKLELDTPFIFKLHTVYMGVNDYAYVIPLIRKYDIILVPSGYAKESFLRISDKVNIQTAPYFLDIKFIQENISCNSRHHKKIITFMGRLVEEKGIGILIKCMREIVDKLNYVHLNIIGPLSSEGITDVPKSPYIKKLEKKVRRLKLNNRIHFKGVRLGLDKYRILSKSDIFVNLTTAVEETFGIVNIEALACGVPVIATNWAGNKELIINGKNGYLININYGKKKKFTVDTGQLVSLIIKVLKNKKFNLKLKKNAAKTAQGYDYRRIIPRLVKLLKNKRVNIKVKNRWNLIKDKKVTDFSHLFKRDFLFFIYCSNGFKNRTYASLYNKTIARQSSFKNKYYPTIKKQAKKNNKDIKIIDKIRQDYLDFLLLKTV